MEEQTQIIDRMIMRKFQQDPLYFIEKMWGLTPQPLKNEFRNEVGGFILRGELDKIKAEHFDNFQKGRHITWQQWAILLAVGKAIKEGKNKISIVSGHRIGKSSCMSWLIIWYLFCHVDAQIGATAPSSEHLHDVLWKEVAVWMDKMPQAIQDLELFDRQSGYVRVKERSETWFARARTARKESPEAMAGLHGEHVFLLADEASGVDDEIYRAAEGSIAGPNVMVILIGNGTRNVGYFYNTHNDDKESAYWQRLSFDSEESPIVTKEYVEEMETRWGRESDNFKIRVSGGFPASEQMDKFGWIPLLPDSQIKVVSSKVEFVSSRKVMGVDPSGEGDDIAVWVVRDNFHGRVVATEASSSAKTIAQRTHELMKEFDIRPEDVVIDNFGVGANVASEILLIDHKAGVTSINWGEDASDEETYLNKRAECCFSAKEWFAKGGAIVGDELQRDLAGYMYRNTLTGKRQILDKPRLKQRLGRSPDRGDAFFLSFYFGADLTSESEAGITNRETKKDIYSAI